MRADPPQPNGGGTADPPKLAPPAKPRGWKSRLTRLVADALPNGVLVSRGSAEGQRVALTFDDGPDDMTDSYLELLAQLGVRATFFMIGRNCVGRRETLLRVLAEGHELAGHGFTHDSFTKMTATALRDELARTADLLPPARTRRPLVRPPRGATSLRSLAVTAAAGYTTVLWSRDSDDCRTASPDEVAARMAPETIAPGEIILLHEGQRWTLDALPKTVERLRAAGYELAPVGELIDGPG
jgi:peptidoglycan/xylan/chitin deacetylase (PgdA/CDA1 family)